MVAIEARLQSEIERVIAIALDEDAAYSDATGMATIPAASKGRATIRAKAAGRLSGVAVATQLFAAIDPQLHQNWHLADGDTVAPGDTLCTIEGSLRSLLAAERSALNFLQHLSGIATATAAFVAATGSGCRVVDTRKTTPGLRQLEKAAVRHGGGSNHRLDLSAGLLIKENHIAAAGSVGAAIEACHLFAEELPEQPWVEVECETLEQVVEAVQFAPDIILLDNMSVAQVAAARRLVPASMLLEASGGITLANAADYAATGVDRIAIGAITHSAPALDLSLRVVAVG